MSPSPTNRGVDGSPASWSRVISIGRYSATSVYVVSGVDRAKAGVENAAGSTSATEGERQTLGTRTTARTLAATASPVPQRGRRQAATDRPITADERKAA